MGRSPKRTTFKDRLDAVIIGLRNGIELVSVQRAIDRDAEESLAHRADDFLESHLRARFHQLPDLTVGHFIPRVPPLENWSR